MAVRNPPVVDDADAPNLDLPPLDGEGHEDEEQASIAGAEEELDAARDMEDALDDATAEADPVEEIAVEGAEAGWLEGSEDAGIDVSTFDVGIGAETKLLEDDEADTRIAHEDLGGDEDDVGVDAGEEGPLADDEELREEDLPQLDADDDGDMDEESLYDRTTLGSDEELRWADRAWTRVESPPEARDDGSEDSGLLAIPGEDPKLGPRDAVWRRFEESGRLTAAVLVPGEGVVVALDTPERPVLVRILADGAASIIAEIEVAAMDDDAPPCRVATLRWNAARGCIVASGSFGTQAFRPA
ncbi:MAG: hypothetical protein JST00_15940 [Deltaproteobacteria bacterium]|nr:hypothetical protein [Deltaproteobacteria bacterium]